MERSSRLFRAIATFSTCVGLATLGIAADAAEKGSEEAFRALRDSRPVNPAANDLRFKPPSTPAPRVLIAGDSWAQYMWDDGSHNDIFDKFGHGEKRALSLSLDSDPGPGYVGPEYAISGSQARH